MEVTGSIPVVPTNFKKIMANPEIGQQENESQEKRISLRDFLTYENPNAENYKRIIEQNEEQPKATAPENHSDGWGAQFTINRPQTKALRAYFEKKLQGTPLIDVGGGIIEWSFIPTLAKKTNAGIYINVDRILRDSYGVPNHEKDPQDPYTGFLSSVSEYSFKEWPTPKEPQPLKIIEVQADVLDFVSRIPDGSCNFSVNGLDISVIPVEEYEKALIRELVRATKVGGIIFGINSCVLPQKNKQFKLKHKELELGLYEPTSGVFEKI